MRPPPLSRVTDRQMDGRTDGWTDPPPDGATDGWMDGRTDGRTDPLIEMQGHI